MMACAFGGTVVLSPGNFTEMRIFAIKTVRQLQFKTSLFLLLLWPACAAAMPQTRQHTPPKKQIPADQPIQFQDIRVVAPDTLPDLRSLRDLQRAHTAPQVQARLTETLQELGELGYAFAKIQLDSIAVVSSAQDSSYSLTARILPGSRVYLHEIRIRGNTSTRDKTIRRELPVKVGALFRESVLDDIAASLSRLGYFRQVATPQLLLNRQGDGVLLIEVQEGQNNAFNGVIGYNPPAGSQAGFVTGLMDVEFGNLFGTGRELSARWEKRGRDTQDLALHYREPWLFGLPLHLQGGFRQILQDTLYVDRSFDLRAELPLLARMSLIGRIETSSITPDSLAMALIPKSSSVAAGLGLRYDNTDDPINPRTGAVYSTLLESIDKNISLQNRQTTLQQSSKQQRLIVDANWYQPLWGLQVLSLGVHWRQLTSADSLNALTDVFRFGGATTLRGYREQQFSGSRIAWANLEYRYLLSRRSRVFLFYDHGYFFRDDREESVEGDKRSFGFGARLETRLGIIGFDYGLGEGDGLQEGKIHVSLVNRF